MRKRRKNMKIGEKILKIRKNTETGKNRKWRKKTKTDKKQKSTPPKKITTKIN